MPNIEGWEHDYVPADVIFLSSLGDAIDDAQCKASGCSDDEITICRLQNAIDSLYTDYRAVVEERDRLLGQLDDMSRRVSDAVAESDQMHDDALDVMVLNTRLLRQNDMLKDAVNTLAAYIVS